MSTTSETNSLISLSQYARQIGKSRETVRLWIHKNTLPAGVKSVKAGNYYFIQRSDER